MGIADVDGMLAGLSSGQFNEWLAYFGILEEERQEQELAAEARAKLDAMKAKGTGR